MRLKGSAMLLTLLLTSASTIFACQVIEGDRVTGKDLANATPLFAKLDPASTFSAAPLPAAQRVFRAEELLRIARNNGIEVSAPVGEICFERATEPLSREKLLPALRTALSLDDAQIEIRDFSRVAVPRGTIEFSRASLSPNGLWRGHVNFGENQSTPIWVRVQITTQQSWVEAVSPLAPGKAIEASQVKQVTGARAPFGPAPVSSIDSAAGQIALRAIKPGEPIFANMLAAARQIERGDTVSVEVSSGGAHLSLEAISQGSGHTGELILLKNPENGRYFQARVEGKDKASIQK